ncbi:unnamed protein product [Parascedosporium putredinis]|uniref:Cutinase n=1 Tax=Parascedosporium putredinis TaxID=1442378 RepID=A0A9P1M8Z3_9PEZI|nr:unnamed protein product [Parascedosporium putredinis]CAI7990848.1 unnamed protein product [Parascedosporium putredinis]
MKFFSPILLASLALATPLVCRQTSAKPLAPPPTSSSARVATTSSLSGPVALLRLATWVPWSAPVANNLKSQFPGKVHVQGVDYAALLSTNFLPGGADLDGIREMKSIIGDITSKCPNAIIVTGGYSQGAALNHRAIEALPAAQQAKIVGVVTFGDTQFRADGGKIPNFPADKVKIICAANPATPSATATSRLPFSLPISPTAPTPTRVPLSSLERSALPRLKRIRMFTCSSGRRAGQATTVWVVAISRIDPRRRLT